MRRTALTAVVALVLLVACAAPGLGGQPSAALAALVDFNGDGFDDLAIGTPGETVGAAVGGAGAVSVFYASGGPGGTVAPGPAFIQGPGGLGGVAEGGETLGFALE